MSKKMWVICVAQLFITGALLFLPSRILGDWANEMSRPIDVAFPTALGPPPIPLAKELAYAMNVPAFLIGGPLSYFGARFLHLPSESSSVVLMVGFGLFWLWFVPMLN